MGSSAALAIDEKRLERFKKRSMDREKRQKMADIFSAMGDPTRLMILFYLAGGELCVCELENLLDMSQSAVSHQLRVLRNLRLAKHRRQGKQVFYSLEDRHIKELLSICRNHVGE